MLADATDATDDARARTRAAAGRGSDGPSLRRAGRGGRAPARMLAQVLTPVVTTVLTVLTPVLTLVLTPVLTPGGPP